MVKTDMLNSFDIVGICSLNFIHVETDIVVYDKKIECNTSGTSVNTDLIEETIDPD
jgi:hypothetical protein